MAYGDLKDLTRRIASDKVLHDKAFNIAKNSDEKWFENLMIKNSFASIIKDLSYVSYTRYICYRWSNQK